MRALSVVPMPAGLRSSSLPPSASTRSQQAAHARAAALVGAADAVVGDLDQDAAVRTAHVHAHPGRARMLGGVRERLGDEVVRRRLDRIGQPVVEPDVQLDRHGGAPRQHLERRHEPVVGEDRRVDAAGQLAQLLERLREVRVGAPEQLGRLRVAVGDLPPDQAQGERERDEPLLRAVVQVALEPAPLVVARRDDARARCRQLLARLGVGQRERDELGEVGDPLLGSRRQRLLLDRRDHAPRPTAGPPSLIGAPTDDRKPSSRSRSTVEPLMPS